MLKENEQRLEESMAEANRLNPTVEEAKEKIEDDKRNAVAPLYDSLHCAQADLCFEGNSRSQEPRRPSLSMNGIMDSARCQIRDPFSLPSKIENSVPERGSTPVTTLYSWKKLAKDIHTHRELQYPTSVRSRCH